MIYMEKAFGAVCFLKSEVDVSQITLAEMQVFKTIRYLSPPIPTKPDNGFSHRRIFVM